MDPDAGVILERRAGDEQQLIAFVNALDIARALAKDSAVDGRAEMAGLIRGKCRRFGRSHHWS
jgi:hypothetical protein